MCPVLNGNNIRLKKSVMVAICHYIHFNPVCSVKEEPEEPAEQMDIKQEPASSPPSRSQAKQNHDRHRSSSASSSHSSGR